MLAKAGYRVLAIDFRAAIQARAGAESKCLYDPGRSVAVVGDRGSGDVLRLPEIRDQYEKALDPKELLVLDGPAHAQFIFATEQGERLMAEILRFLSQP